MKFKRKSDPTLEREGRQKFGLTEPLGSGSVYELGELIPRSRPLMEPTSTGVGLSCHKEPQGAYLSLFNKRTGATAGLGSTGFQFHIAKTKQQRQ